MTIEELIEELQKCDTGEPSGDHYKADRLLLEYIGSPEVTQAFGDIPKWYE